MSSLDVVLQYRKQVDQAQRQVVLAEGALKRARKDLKKEFNCIGTNRGFLKLQHLKSKAKKCRNKAEIKLKNFKKKWKDQLDF